MSSNHTAQLAAIRTFPALIKYLRDEMGWPIGPDSFEDLTFDFEPEELGIDAKNAAKISEIKRLRPLSSGQPFGIFFVKFEPKRLPVVALRRILSQVVLKKRATAKAAEHAAWAADDLLFVSNYGEGDARHISFAHFSTAEDSTDLPTLKVLGWDNLDTPLHLSDIAERLKQHLSWPDDEEDAKAWRNAWRSAFDLRHREVITTSKDLSVRLAELARGIRDRITSALAIETEAGPLTKLMKAFQTTLVHDLDAEGFADMYAQTIAYGLLSARIADPRKKTADDFAAHMRTNPFLRELMETFLRVGGRRGRAGGPGIDFDELGVSEVVGLLDRANMEAVLRDFGDRNPEEDPVIHFYELFLKEYDAGKRMQRGVFYTPRPVVSYIVRSVDELLRSDFGLAYGLADTTTWGEMAKRHGNLAIPSGVSPDQDFVQILDPATGTGTFLVEVIDLIHKTLVAKWKAQGHSEKQIDTLWNEYVPKHLLTRLHGYELLMAPYAIAHLKVGLKLYETGYRFGSNERARIYLTNALEPAHDFSGTLEFAVPALAHEAQAVNTVKSSGHFTAIIGNPPYANYSANLSPQARKIVDKYRNFHGTPIRERNQLQFERNLQDDFVKFISVGQDYVRAAGAGVLSLITNATMLASPSLRGMRESLSREFSRLFELHLHGGGNEISAEAVDDENVFDIVQAVAIHVYVRSKPGGSTEIRYADLFGRRSRKYASLGSECVTDTKWHTVSPDRENHGFIPQDQAAGEAGYGRLDEAFVKFGAGIKTNRDAVAIGFDKASVLASVRDFDRKLTDSQGGQANIKPILYRPFDVRKIFYHEDVVASRSFPTMKHMLSGPNIGLVCSSVWTSPDRFSVGVSRIMVEMKTGTHDRGTTFFPLYRYDAILNGKATRVHNLTASFVRDWCAKTGTKFVHSGQGDCVTKTGPEDVLFFLFALFHSPEYRRRYRAALAQRFPLVFFPSDARLLRNLVIFGEKLVALHLLEDPGVAHPITELVGARNPDVEKISWSNNTVWIDKAQATGFRGVRKDVWEFHVGGYQVCEKWLKDRKGQTLSTTDVTSYQKIIVAISETIRIMGEIDDVIGEYGGWQAAFLRSDPSVSK